jgi:predicted Zn-ribbon and HTH transcriptional regulator
MLSEKTKVIKKYEPFILGKCQCGCETDIDIFSPKSKGRKTGYLRKYADRSHALTSRDQWGENNVNWKGGEPKQDKDGYWLIYSPNHPYKNSQNRVFEHRLIYENYLSILFDEQIYLPEGSEIHHIDGNPENNSLINLKYMSGSLEHKQEHLVDYSKVKCKTCGSEYTPTRSDSKSKRPKWHGNDINGHQCVSCYKKDYYVKNKDKREKYKRDNYDRILKKQKEYNDTKRKGRGVSK